MLSAFRSHIAILYLFIMVQMLLPPEFLHSFSGHEDTHCKPHEGKSLEKHHHHCESLNIEVPVYIVDDSEKIAEDFSDILIKDVKIPFLTDKISIVLPGLRAPPKAKV